MFVIKDCFDNVIGSAVTPIGAKAKTKTLSEEKKITAIAYNEKGKLFYIYVYPKEN